MIYTITTDQRSIDIEAENPDQAAAIFAKQEFAGFAIGIDTATQLRDKFAGLMRRMRGPDVRRRLITTYGSVNITHQSPSECGRCRQNSVYRMEEPNRGMWRVCTNCEQLYS